MIDFRLGITNPWAKNRPPSWNFDKEQPYGDYDYLCKDWKLSKNKSFEIQFSKTSLYNLIMLDFDFSWRGRDHAGIKIQLEFFGYWAIFNLYDHRHWDYDNGTWEKY